MPDWLEETAQSNFGAGGFGGGGGGYGSRDTRRGGGRVSATFPCAYVYTDWGAVVA